MNYVTPMEAVSLIKSGDNVYIQGAAAIPDTLVNAMTQQANELRGVNIYSAFAIDKGAAPYAHAKFKENFIVNSFFVSGNIREHVAEGHGDYIPSHLSEIPKFLREGLIKIDVVLINVSPPDEHGYCSMGVSVDITKSAVDTAKLIVAQVNKYQPRVFGDAVIHSSKFAAAILADDPLTEVPEIQSTEVDIAIGKFIAQRIPDSATLQIGVGGIPNAVLSQLKNHKHLGLHTEAMTEGVVRLIQAGIIDNSRKTLHRGFSIASLAVGTRKLYDFMNNNPSIQMLDVAYTNDPWVIRQNDNMRSVNAAIEVDLTGQVVSDSVGQRIYSGVGGQHDFMYGASLSKGGATFIALPSATTKGISKIVPTLTPGGGVVTPRSIVQNIVTEYGIAEMRCKTLVQRAQALIAVAHPSARENLERAAYQRYGREIFKR